MSNRSVTFELPEDILTRLGPPEAVSARAKEALVLELLRESEISQGKAAELLGLTRWGIIDLMAEYEIPSGPRTAEEMQEEIEAVRRYVQEHPPHGGR